MDRSIDDYEFVDLGIFEEIALDVDHSVSALRTHENNNSNNNNNTDTGTSTNNHNCGYIYTTSEQNHSNFIDTSSVNVDNNQSGSDAISTNGNFVRFQEEFLASSSSVTSVYQSARSNGDTTVYDGDKNPKTKKEGKSRFLFWTRLQEKYFSTKTQQLLFRDVLIMIFGSALPFIPKILEIAGERITFIPILLSVWARVPASKQSIFDQIDLCSYNLFALIFATTSSYIILAAFPRSPEGVLVFQFWSILFVFYCGLKHKNFLLMAAFTIIFQSYILLDGFHIFNFAIENKSNAGETRTDADNWLILFTHTYELWFTTSFAVLLHFVCSLIIFPFRNCTDWTGHYRNCYVTAARLLIDVTDVIENDWNVYCLNRSQDPNAVSVNLKRMENLNEMKKDVLKIRKLRATMSALLRNVFVETRWHFNGRGLHMLQSFRKNKRLMRLSCYIGEEITESNIWQTFPMQLEKERFLLFKTKLVSLIIQISRTFELIANVSPGSGHLFSGQNLEVESFPSPLSSVSDAVDECDRLMLSVNEMVIQWAKESETNDMVFKTTSYLPSCICELDEIVRLMKRFQKLESESQESYSIFVDWPFTMRVFQIFSRFEHTATQPRLEDPSNTFGRLAERWYQRWYRIIVNHVDSAEFKTSLKVALCSIIITSFGYFPSTAATFSSLALSNTVSTVQSCFRTLHLGLVFQRAYYRFGGMVTAYIYASCAWQIVHYFGESSSFIQGGWTSYFLGLPLIFLLIYSKYYHPQHIYGAYSLYKEFFVITLQQLTLLRDDNDSNVWVSGGWTTFMVMLGAILASIFAVLFWPVTGKSELRKLLAHVFFNFRLQFEYSIINRHKYAPSTGNYIDLTYEKSEDYLAKLLTTDAQVLLKAASFEPIQIKYDLPLAKYEKMIKETTAIWRCLWKLYHIRDKRRLIKDNDNISIDLNRMIMKERRIIAYALETVGQALSSARPPPVLSPILAYPHVYYTELVSFLKELAEEEQTKVQMKHCDSVQTAFVLSTIYSIRKEMSLAFEELYTVLLDFLGQVNYAQDLYELEKEMLKKTEDDIQECSSSKFMKRSSNI